MIFKSWLFAILFASALVAVASESATEVAEDAAKDIASVQTIDLTIEEILQRDPEQADYGEAPRCLQTQRIRSVDVIDDKHIAFRVSRKQYYLVQFKHRCPGLRRGKPIITEPGAGSRLCVLDGIRATYENGLGGLQPGMRCAINGFQSVTKEQLVLLKDALKVERRKKKNS